MSQPSDLDGNAFADPVDSVDERVHRSDRAHASAGPSGGEDRSRPASDVDQGSRRPGTRDAESARAAASPTGASARPPQSGVRSGMEIKTMGPTAGEGPDRGAREKRPTIDSLLLGVGEDEVRSCYETQAWGPRGPETEYGVRDGIPFSQRTTTTSGITLEG